MAIISLRAYNREIESLIERGQHEQAIFHCRHILQYFPKHIDTYRLLGKTYLESQRYSDAADILQRVLSSIPDDFVSHVGLSIIREDEGNLNDAVWHMERAFETQPSNSAIQAELRRLRNKRDGYDAPKVRLTRGALARMYMKGDLYPQAIAELRAALAEDPKRLDLQILLGQCYLGVDQRVEAAETCSIILHKLPNALEANRILEQILSTTERAEEARACRERVQALDPYYAHTTSSRPDAALVSDDAVVLEKGSWQPGRSSGQPGTQPEWAASLGVKVDDIAPDQQDVPEWLSDATSSARQAPEPEEELAQDAPPSGEKAEDFIPDWLKDAGWGLSSSEGELQETEAELPSGLEEPAAVEAEIPDWLQAIAPENASAEPASSDELESEPEGVDWLVQPEQSPPGEIAELPQSEAELDLGDIQVPSEVPDWLIELGEEEQQAVPPTAMETPDAEEIPDWLAELAPEDQTDQAIQAQEELVSDESEDIPQAALPDWLKDIEPEAEVETDLPDAKAETSDIEGGEWSFEFGETAEAGLPSEEALPAEAEEIPDWLAQLSSETPTEQPTSELGGIGAGELTAEPDEFPAEELPDWMKEIEQGYEMAESTKDDESRDSRTELPDEPLADQQAPAQESAQPSSPFTMESDEDAAFAWLESLAAKQGAREDELLLPPEQRQDTPPEWVSESEVEEPEPDYALPAALAGATAHLEFPDEESDQAGGEEIPDWLKDIQRRTEEETSADMGEADFPKATPAFAEEDLEAELSGLVSDSESGTEEIGEAESAELPDWLSQLESEIEAEIPPLEEEKAEAVPLQESQPEPEAAALPNWLSERDEEPELETPAPTEPIEFEPEAAELPDWLQEIDAEVEPAASPLLEGAEAEAGDEPEPEAEAADLPDWLRDFETEIEQEEPSRFGDAEKAQEEVYASEEAEAEPAVLPDWLQEVSSEPEPESQPMPWPEEPEIIEGDTKPSTGLLRHLEEGSGQPVPEQVLPAEDAGELPDWLLEMAEEAAVDELPTVEPESAAEVAVTQGEEEPEIAAQEPIALSDWIEQEAPTLEAAAIEEEPEPIEAPFAFEAPVEETAGAVEPADAEMDAPAEAPQPLAEMEVVDEDAAFAWLESLAAQQGAKEEELLLEPEERAAQPPDWIKKVLDTGELPPPEAIEPGLPAFIEARTSAAGDLEGELHVSEEPGIEQEEAVAAEAMDLTAAEQAEADLAAPEPGAESIVAAEGEATEEEVETEVAMVEQMFQPQPAVEEMQEEVPELPSWLQDLAEPVQEEDTGWTPPEETPSPAPVELEAVDLNTASLKELERLPGVGFIRAQALIAYRDANGPLSNVGELSLVDGFDADIIEGLRDLVWVEAPAPAAEAIPMPVSSALSEESEMTLLQARNELVQNLSQSALQKYLSLIEAEELLEEVIRDLQEALHRMPSDVDIWQALGDAQLRTGHIQDALNAYTRAEELLRKSI